MSRNALLALVSASVTLLAVGQAASVAAQPLKRGSEATVAALVISGGPLRDGTRIESVQLRARSINVALEDGSGVHHEVSLFPNGAGGAATLAHTPSFDLVGDRSAAAVAGTLAARIRGRDDGHFWATAATVRGGDEQNDATTHFDRSHDAATPLGWGDDLRRLLGWLALGALLVSGGIRAARRTWRSKRARRAIVPTLGAALAVFVMALALRVVVTPWAPLHSNEHGVATVRGLVAPHTKGRDESTRYGVAYAQLVRPLAAFTEGDWRVPFALAALSGALTAMLALYLARALTRSLAAGVAAGVGLALHPMHVRVSGSETSLVLAAALAMVALLGVHYALDTTRARRARIWAVWMTGLATAASLELSWTAPAFAVGVGLFAMALWRPGAFRGMRSHAAGAVGWTAIAAGLHVVSLAGLDSGASAMGFLQGDFALTDILTGQRSGLWDASMASALLMPLAAAGAVALLWTRRARGLVGLLLFGAVVLIAAALVASARRDVIRYAAGAHVVHFVLSGCVVSFARRPLVRAALAAVVCLLLLGTSLVGLADVARPDATATEWAVALDAPPGLRSVVVAPSRLTDKVLSDYPNYLPRPPPQVIRTRTHEPRWCRVWIGMPCWSFSREELAERTGSEVDVGIGPMRAECVELLGGVDAVRRALPSLTPVEVRHRDGELHVIPTYEPRIGYAPCVAR